MGEKNSINGNITIEKLVEFREKRMLEYAQKSNESDRKVGIEKEKISQYGDLFIRNEFSRDRDRIKFSRAFRRLEHKAQIYSHEKGDHFRTRLTHTLEVSQIARSLAINLNLNEDLVEAITLGHDIGHTPYGHQGERTLDNIMAGKDNLSGKIKYQINYGGFKHNYHSLKILDQLEIKYPDHKGMNLTWQVLEGILKHTITKRHKNGECKKCDDCYDIRRFISDQSILNDYFKCLEYDNSVTLEGQIVAIADEIAQRQHDIDDGLRDEGLKLKFNDISEELIREFKEILKGKKDDNNMCIVNLDNLIKSMEELKNIQFDIERKELYRINTLVRNFIDFFIKDVTINSLIKLYEDDNCIEKNKDYIFIKGKFIEFSGVGDKVNKKIEDYIKSKILNSYNVNRFDGKAIYIIRQLFKAYYTNPRQMPEYVLERLSNKVGEISKSIYRLKFLENKFVDDIKFAGSKPDEINALITIMKLDFDITENEFNIFNEGQITELKGRKYINEKNSFKKEILIDINKKDKKQLDKLDEINKIIKVMIEIHYVYLSVICDYIAGMTDNYASSEFKKLYLVD